MSYKHILLATDLTNSYEEIAKKAKALAGVFSASLSLVHVVEPIPTYSYSLYSNVDLETKLEEEAKSALGKLAESLGVSVDAQHSVMGSPKHEVLALAERLNCDLIVVGSHSRTGLAFLMGSTANGIVQSAQCDVLTIYHGND